MKKFRSVVALALAILLLCPALLYPPARADGDLIQIGDAAALREFAKNCSLDAWSRGKQVMLTADIDLAGQSFSPIPIFSGTFDGGGYRIKGLLIDGAGSNLGLFRYLEKGGVIKNLWVEGIVTPGGDKSYVGAVVGNNSGRLENCHFSGYVKGKDVVGGLVGWNGTEALVMESSADGVVLGESKVGGLCGYNAGSLLRSENRVGVNNTVEEETLDLTELSITDFSFSRLVTDSIDIGGVCGVNSGVIMSCENYGTIGYPHVGYNVGGIAGRQNGYITSSVNYGEILGRKSVGGVVGQMEPHLSSAMPPSKLKQLQRELAGLEGSITRLLSHTDSLSAEVGVHMQTIKKNLDQTQVYVESLVNQTEALLNQDIDEINRISVIIMEAIDRLVPIMDDMQEMIEILNKALPDLRSALSYMNKALSSVDLLAYRFDELSAAMEYPMEQLMLAAEYLEQALPPLIEAIEGLLEGRMDGVVDLLNEAFEAASKARVHLENAFEDFDIVMEQMRKLLAVLQSMSQDMRLSLHYLETAMETLERAMVRLPKIIGQMRALFDYVSSQPPLDFATTGDYYQQTKEELFRAAGQMSDSVFALVDVIERESHVLIADFQDVSDRLFVVFDLLIGLVEEVTAGTAGAGDIYEDVSQEDVDKETEGKVSLCRNEGTVAGDLDVGGISGAMSVELVANMDKEVIVSLEPSLRKTYQSRTVISDCENSGSVLAKKNAAGGIVGNMRLGYVQRSLNSGPVESSDGHYVGGIAGMAAAPISRSYAKCTLAGDNYIGGIVGLGVEVSQSASMVVVSRAKAYVGAIAGNMEEDKVLKANYFVSDALAGVDGISYQGRAEPVTYEELLALPELPELFSLLTVTFMADEEILSRLEFHYGDSVSPTDFPAIPEKAGHYGRWDVGDLSALVFDHIARVNYFPYVSLLESAEKRSGPLSVLLVEGTFTDTDEFSLAALPIEEEPEPEGAVLMEAWQVVIPDDGNAEHRFRYIPPDKSRYSAIFVKGREGWSRVATRRDGKYLVFQVQGTEVFFALAAVKSPFTVFWFLGFFLLLAVAAYWLFRRSGMSGSPISSRPWSEQ